MPIETKKFNLNYLQYGCVAVAFIFSLHYALIHAPWCDEIAYVDPGAQLYFTGKMTSTAWVTNSPEVLWGSSNPGMPLLFAVWFKLIGFGQLQARLLFCLLHFVGVFLFFRWIRTHYTPSGWALTLGIVSTLLLPSLSNAIFQCRLESLAFLLFVLFVSYVWSNTRGYLNDFVAPLGLGLLTIFFGLHFAGFFVLAACAVFIGQSSRHTFIQGVGLLSGIIIGLLTLYCVYSKLGLWEIFIAARACHYGRYLEWVPIGWNRFNLTFDLPVLAFLAILGFISALFCTREIGPRAWLPWILALAIFIFTPLLIGLIGIYYGNYSWMVALPMMICFYKGAPFLKGWFKKIFIGILLVCLVVSGVKISKLTRKAVINQRVHKKVAEILVKNLNKNDAVAADFPLYYELVEAGFGVYPRTNVQLGLQLGFEKEKFLPAKTCEKIICIVTQKNKSADVQAVLGGDWRLLTEVPFLANGKSDQDYQIYLRR